jgi:hypothetical protein
MRTRILSVLTPLLLTVASPVAADAIKVTLDTSPLIGGATAPYYVDFQLVDGDGAVNNSVTVSNFAFGGGGAVGVPLLTGDASGDLSTAVSLGDLDFFNAFTQQFSPGATLSFDVEFTTDSVGVTPDRFTFAILNSALVEVPTAGAGNELLGIDLWLPVVVELYAGVDIGSGDPVLLAPTIPEPGTAALLGVFAAALYGKRRFIKRRGNV